MEKRYEVQPGPRRGTWCVIDTQTGQAVMRERDEAMVRRFAAARNEQAAAGTLPQAPAAAPPAAPEKSAMRPGWSKAAQRRRNISRSHPLGEVVEAGDGYTIYEDTAFGGGRVQIWDES